MTQNTPAAEPHATNQTDRYVSFCGIDCNGNANRLIEMLQANLDANKGDSRWRRYFTDKRAQQQRMQQDNLYFVGAQVNTLYSYFQNCDDQAALALLWTLEQECC